MGSSRETIVNILNEANCSEKNRSDRLANAFELLFHKEQSLLDEYYPILIEFALDRSNAIKKQVIPYIEAICKRYPKFLVQSENTLSFLLNNVSDQGGRSIVKRTILCITNICRSSLSYIVYQNQSPNSNQIQQQQQQQQQQPTIEQQQAVWKSYNELKNKVVKFLSDDDESVKINVFKFLEIVILSYSSPGEYPSKKYKSDDEFSLDKVPIDHQIISKKQLQSECQVYLSDLLDCAKDLTNMTSANIMILVTSLTTIVRQRFSLLSIILPVLSNCPNILPKFQTVQNESIKHSLKTCLLSIIRLKNQIVLPFIPQLIEGLAQIDAKEQGEEAARWYRGEPEKNKQKRQYNNNTDIDQNKRLKYDNQMNNNNNDNFSFNNNNNNNNNMNNSPPIGYNNNINNNGYSPPVQGIPLPGLNLDANTQSRIISNIPNIRGELVTNFVLENMSYTPLHHLLQNIPFNHKSKNLYEFVNSYPSNVIPLVFNLSQSQPQQFNSNNNSFNQQQGQQGPYFNQQQGQGQQQGGFNKSPILQSQQPQLQQPQQPQFNNNLPPQPMINNVMGYNNQQPQPQQPQPQPQPQQQQQQQQPQQEINDEPTELELAEFEPELEPELEIGNLVKTEDLNNNKLDKEKEIQEKENGTNGDINGGDDTNNSNSNSNQNNNNNMIVPVIGKTEIIPSVRPRPVFSVTKIGSSQAEKISDSAVKRIKSAEGGAIIGGSHKLWIDLLSKIVAIKPTTKDVYDEFVDFILKDFTQHRELALQWLYNEFFIAKEISIEDDKMEIESKNTDIKMERYSSILMNMIVKIVKTFDPRERVLSTFILDVPFITDELLDTICKVIINFKDQNESFENADLKKEEPSDQDTALALTEKSDATSTATTTTTTEPKDRSEWITLGLSTLRDLVFWRPTVRSKCLSSLLEFAIHSDDDLRMPSIRLVTNQLYSKPALTETIQLFSKTQILDLTTFSEESVLKQEEEREEKESKDSNVDDNQVVDGDDTTDKSTKTTDTSMDNGDEQQQQPLDIDKEEQNQKEEILNQLKKESRIIKYIERKLFLFYSLCTKNHSLITDLLETYPRCEKVVQDTITRLIGNVTKSIGQTSESLLLAISICPSGAEPLLIEILSSLVEVQKPTPELVSAVKRLMNTSSNNNQLFLLPILHGLTKEEIISKLPVFISLPSSEDTKKFIAKMASNGSPISPSELMVQLHLIPDQSKKVLEAIDYCFELKSIFKQEYMAVTIQQLLVQTPLPLLLMRTVLKTLSVYPRLKLFIVEVMHQLVARQVWNFEKPWLGFLLCAKNAKPESLEVILQLPTPQFEMAIKKDPELADFLVRYLKPKPPSARTVYGRNIKLLGDIPFERKVKSSSSSSTSSSSTTNNNT